MDGIKHWWNGSWGRLTRRDIFLRTDGTHWELEARIGGVEGRRTIRAVDDREAGEKLAVTWMDPRFTWSELPP